MKTFNLHKCIARGLRLLKEGGNTRRSISNAKILFSNMELDRATLYLEDSCNCRLHTEWSGSDGFQDILFTHDFTGLSAGYCGEGSRGLIEVLRLFNIPCTRNNVFTLKPGVYRLFKVGEEPVKILTRVFA